MAVSQQLTLAQRQQMAVQANLIARQAVIKQGVDMILNIFTTTVTNYTAGIANVINVPIRNVGLIKRFWVEVAAAISCPTTTITQTLTPFGPSNFFSNITFTDLSNQTRINTAGWHLTMISSAKRRKVIGGAMTTDTPFGFGNNFTKVIAAPASVSVTSTTNNMFAYFEVPLAYTDLDLRGSIYANVTNATMNLQLTVNPNLFVASGGDPTLAVYQSSGATLGTMPTFTVTVYQNFLDQLPQSQNGGAVLPLLDVSTAYLLNNTPVSGLVANQDIPIPFANFRDFMSTTIIYDNAGVLNTGSDVAYWAIQVANYTNIVKYDAATSAFLTRLILEDDPPKGTYYFNHRDKPIATIQYGNEQIIANLSTVTSGASTLIVGWESLALINQITQAGSLYGN